MEMKLFNVTMLGNDMSLDSDDINYATLGHGSHHGLQINVQETNGIYGKILSLCQDIHTDFVELTKLLNYIKDNGQEKIV